MHFALLLPPGVGGLPSVLELRVGSAAHCPLPVSAQLQGQIPSVNGKGGLGASGFAAFTLDLPQHPFLDPGTQKETQWLLGKHRNLCLDC